MNTENNVSFDGIVITNSIVSQLSDLQRVDSDLGKAHIRAIDNILNTYILEQVDADRPAKRLLTIENLTALKETIAILSNLG